MATSLAVRAVEFLDGSDMDNLEPLSPDWPTTLVQV